MKILLLLALLLNINLGAVDDAAPISLTVTPHQQTAPGRIRFVTRIAQHRDNFWFCVGFDSESDYSESVSSCQQLNGIYSLVTFYIEYHDLTPGEYKAFARLYRVPNRLAASATPQNFIVSSP